MILLNVLLGLLWIVAVSIKIEFFEYKINEGAHLVAGTTFAAFVMFSIIKHPPEVHLHLVIDLQESNIWVRIFFKQICNWQKRVAGVLGGQVLTWVDKSLSSTACRL